MFSRRNKLLNLVLIISALTVLFFTACKKKEQVNTPVDVNESKEITVPVPQYANDLDRLNTLSERINSACGKTGVFTLGSNNSAAGSLIGIDYGLFDRLSDDGAAVLMAHTLTMSSQVSVASEAAQANNNTSILRIDETAGLYVGRANFRPEGFTEFLQMSRITNSGNTASVVSDDMRLAAFMRGYLSAKENN